MFGEKGLLANAVLRDRQGSTVRTDDGVPLRFGDGCGRDVFELERDDVDAAGERAHRVEIVVRRVDLFVGDLAGRCVVVGRQRVDTIAEPAGRHGEHAPKLTATQDAYSRTWKYHNLELRT